MMRVFVLGAAALVVVGLLGAFWDAQPVVAQDQGFNIAISPLPINLSAAPGTTTSTDIRVRNLNTAPEELEVELFTFRVDEDEQVVIEEAPPEDDFLSWVSFSEERFTVEANQFYTIRMAIDVPSTAAFGYYYAVVISRAGEPPVAPGAAALEGSVAIFVLLEAPVPGMARTLELGELTARRRVFEFLPAEFNVRVINNGDIHVVPLGNIFIKKGGRELGVVEVNVNQGNVLPGSTRTFTAAWREGFPRWVDREEQGRLVTAADGTPERRLEWNLGQITDFQFGKYQAELVMIYNDGARDIPLAATVEFWVVPWRLLAAGLLLLGLLCFGSYSALKRLLKRQRPVQRWR